MSAPASRRPPPPLPGLLPIERWTIAALVALTAARFTVAALAGLSPDEAYYWLWARPLQLSYFDHPGMVAWMIWCGVHLFGDTAFGVRFPALLCSLFVSALVWDAARIVWSDRAAAARATLWLNATLLFGVAGILMTPDAPLILFWSLALWAVLQLLHSGRARWLYVAALGFGLAAISKYTIGLLIPGALLVFILFADLRRWFASVHLWLALILSALCTAPVIVWNSRHQWASVAKQFDHAFAAPIPHPLGNLGAFVGGQIGIVTPILFVFLIWAAGWSLVAGWRGRRADWFLLGIGSLPILAFFAIHALSNVVQAHWPGPAYIGAALIAAGAPMVSGARTQARRIVIGAAPILGLLITGLVYLQAATAIIPLPTRIDPTKHLADARPLADAVQAARLAHPGAVLMVTKHEIGGLVSFYLPDHATAFEIDSRMRPSFYDADAVAALRGHDAIIITTARDDIAFTTQTFSSVTPITNIDLRWHGRIADRYRLVFAQAYRGGLITESDGYPGKVDSP